MSKFLELCGFTSTLYRPSDAFALTVDSRGLRMNSDNILETKANKAI